MAVNQLPLRSSKNPQSGIATQVAGNECYFCRNGCPMFERGIDLFPFP